MRVRALDVNGDWTFGKGKNDYLIDIDAVAQNIQTRLLMFLGDCFFSLTDGIDWFNLLGSKNEAGLVLAVKTVLVNTPGVTGIEQVSVSLSTSRAIKITFNVQTSYGRNIQNTFQYDLPG